MCVWCVFACARTGAGSGGDNPLDARSWVFVFFYLLSGIFFEIRKSSKSLKSLNKFTKLKNSRLRF